MKGKILNPSGQVATTPTPVNIKGVKAYGSPTLKPMQGQSIPTPAMQAGRNPHQGKALDTRGLVPAEHSHYEYGNAPKNKNAKAGK